MTMDGLYDYQQCQVEDVCAAGQGRGQRSDTTIPRIPNMAYLYRTVQQERTRTRRGRGRARMLKGDNANNFDSRPGHVQRAVSPVPAPVPEIEVVPQSEPLWEDRVVPESLQADRSLWRDSDFPKLGTDEADSVSTNSHTEPSTGNLLADITGSFIAHSDNAHSIDVSDISDGMDFPLPTDRDPELDHFVIPQYKAKIVKPKSSVNKFNFAAVNKSLLDDISALQGNAKQKPPKVLSLTKANLDKYLNANQSDTLVQNSRTKSHMGTNMDMRTKSHMGTNMDMRTKSHMGTNMDMRKFVFDEEGPFDDIQLSKKMEVPADVKGRLNLLMDRMDEPFVDVDEVGNINNNAKKSDEGISLNSGQFITNGIDDFCTSSTLEEQYKGDGCYATAEAGCHADEGTYGCYAAAEGGDLTDNCDCSNDSVISGMSDSNYNVSSEDDFVTGDFDDKYMKQFEKGPPTKSAIDHIVTTDRDEKNILQDNEQCAINDVQSNQNLNNEGLKTEIKRRVEEFSADPTMSITNQVDPVVNATIPVSDSSEDSELGLATETDLDLLDNRGKERLTSQLCETTVAVPVAEPASLTKEDLEGFMLVKGKHAKKKSLKPIARLGNQRPVNLRRADNTVWRLYGKCVIQVDGLPHDCDITPLHEAVSGFGRVVDHQTRQIDMGCSVRFKLCSEDACDYAIQCLHNTECLYPDANKTMECYKPQV